MLSDLRDSNTLITLHFFVKQLCFQLGLVSNVKITDE